MESNYELKEIDIKNRTCYYFDDIMRVEYFDFDNILLDKKSYEDSFENFHLWHFIRNIYGCKTNNFF